MDMEMDMDMDMGMDMSSSAANMSLSHTPCKMSKQKSLDTADEDEEDKLLLGHNDDSKIGDRFGFLRWNWMPIARISAEVRQQVLRAVIYGVQFAISYTVMMMWMYSNGAITGFGMFTRDMLEVSGYTHVDEGENDGRGESCC
ncbi:hypothetical protein ACHAPG_007662 [Botrytis cinerea]